MRKVGMITIGQAPRQDIAPIVEKHLAGRAELVQAGVLDQMTKAEIANKLAPTASDYVLTSRLTSGESVVLSRERIQPILQQKIADMERSGIRNILLLCTGVFPGLRAEQAFCWNRIGSFRPWQQLWQKAADSACLCLWPSRWKRCGKNTRRMAWSQYLPSSPRSRWIGRHTRRQSNRSKTRSMSCSWIAWGIRRKRESL